MKEADRITEELIAFLESNNFQYTLDRNPSEEKIKIINERIAKNKKIHGDHG